MITSDVAALPKKILTGYLDKGANLFIYEVQMYAQALCVVQYNLCRVALRGSV